jgi:hypothetical protein
MSSETGDMATFQQGRSEFAEIVKYLINEVAKSATRLEDHMLMHPTSGFERRAERDPYRDFRAAFRELYFLTFNTVRNSVLKLAIDLWFLQHYDVSTKDETFLQGIAFAKEYLTEMYNLGLLDLNVSEPVDFPFEDVIRDISAEKARFSQMNMDILLSMPIPQTSRAMLGNGSQIALNKNISDGELDVSSLVNSSDSEDEDKDEDIVQTEEEYFDQFDVKDVGDSRYTYIEDDIDYTDEHE